MDKYIKFSDLLEYLRNRSDEARKCGHEETYYDLLTIINGLKDIETVPASALGKDTNVPTNPALDHIHNVVAEREYQRGYKKAKEEYDHKLAVIKRTIKDYWYIKGKEDGKADAAKWIPVSDRLPEEKINPNTHDFEEVLCSTTFGDVRAYKFGKPLGWEKPHFWHGGGMMDEYVLAWVEKPEPWNGVRYGTVI